MDRLTPQSSLTYLAAILTLASSAGCTNHRPQASGGSSLSAGSSSSESSSRDQKTNPESKQSKFAKAPAVSSLGQGDEKGSMSGMTSNDTGNVSGNAAGAPSEDHKAPSTEAAPGKDNAAREELVPHSTPEYRP